VPLDGFPVPVPPTLGGPGFGFGQGDPLDVMPPGKVLAGLAEDAQRVLAGIDDDCLTGIIRAWRRLTSWATGCELAAVAELSRRLPTDGLPGSGREYVADELAAALTLTGLAAQGERDLAWQLANVLPATLAALCAGLIDLAKARVIVNGTADLDPGHAAAVEASVLPKAPGQTTGQLRAAVAKAVLSADPDAATRQREAAQARAHVSCWTGQSGTGHLEGHDLPPAQTLAADARLGQIAAAWKAKGAQGGMDLLRAHAYLALLLGHDTTTPPGSLLTPNHRPTHPDTQPVNTGPQSPRIRSADAGTPNPGGDKPTPQTSSPPADGPQTSSPPGDGPQTSSLQADGPQADDAQTSSPPGDGAQTSRPQADGPQISGPPGDGAQTSSPPADDAQASGPQASGPQAEGPQTSPSSHGVHPGPSWEPQAPAGLRPPEPEPGFGLPPVAAMINLTVPLATLLQLSNSPGEVVGYGPVAPDTARVLADAAAGHPATSWRLTVTSPDGHALATGSARSSRRGQPITADGWTVTLTAIPLGDCDHQQREPGYRPSPALAGLIRARTTTCSFPGCRRPARRCDLDHSVPYEVGGPTCPCNLAPLCRHHHRVKQAEGWTLIQPSPGVLVWLTPAGRRYTTLPSQHPT
jgi:Domain of unknown function (DUF222)